MKIKGELTFKGNKINTPEEFMEDLCDRLNRFTSEISQMKQPEMKLMMLKGFIEGISNKLNRVCER